MLGREHIGEAGAEKCPQNAKVLEKHGILWIWFEVPCLHQCSLVLADLLSIRLVGTNTELLVKK